jgi:hypothetical protein
MGLRRRHPCPPASRPTAISLQNLRAQLRADEAASNTAAVAADRTAVRLARMQLRLDFGELNRDAQSIVQPDLAALKAALTQLHADQVANNASGVQSDQLAVQNAETQLRTDRANLFGDLGVDGLPRRHGRG